MCAIPAFAFAGNGKFHLRRRNLMISDEFFVVALHPATIILRYPPLSSSSYQIFNDWDCDLRRWFCSNSEWFRFSVLIFTSHLNRISRCDDTTSTNQSINQWVTVCNNKNSLICRLRKDRPGAVVTLVDNPTDANKVRTTSCNPQARLIFESDGARMRIVRN